MAILEQDASKVQVPPQALLLSLLSLWVPVTASSLFPAWINEDVGILLWLLALIPPFLLSYYRGWRGASVALAGAMAAFTIAQLAVTVTGASPPSADLMLGLLIVLIAVSLGSGVLACLFHRSLDEAEQMAFTDPGTGLPNRRHGTLHLQRAFAAADRGRPVSVVMFDLDRFKQVNDRFGHHTGDEVLRTFGRILTEETRCSDLSLRFGGEEFMTVLDGSGAHEGRVFADRVRARLQDHDFSWGRLTVSAGISQYEHGMASPDVLIAAADQALYRAKERGGDRVVVLARQGSSHDEIVASRPSHDAGEGNGELVLIVDDDPAVLRTLSRALRRRRYQPLEASDPVKALQIVRGLEEPLDLVVADVVMPAMSGFRLVEMLLDIQPDLRALYISGYSSEEVSWSGVPGSVKSFLPKPMSLDSFTGAVQAILQAAPQPRPKSPVEEPAGSPPQLQDRLEATSARLDDAYSELLVRLAWTAEYRDDTTGEHAERVGRLAGLLATRLGLSQARAGQIEQAALLHDLGKIAIPDSILHKPDTLTHTEREIMQRHCVVGASLLAGSRSPLLQAAERIARSHHERWDGDGYPDRLAGEDIPLEARITAVADAYDSLTETRPYRAAVGRAEALARIRRDRGTHFDPAVVDALVELTEVDSTQSFEPLEMAGEWIGKRSPRLSVR